MKKTVSTVLSVLVLIALASSTSADPPSAFEGRFFSVERFGRVAMPDGDVILITGSHRPSPKGGAISVKVFQSRGRNDVYGSGRTYLSTSQDQWEIEITEIEGVFRPGPVTIRVEWWQAADWQLGEGSMILTGRPIAPDAVITCPECGAEVPSDVTSCPSCGVQFN